MIETTTVGLGVIELLLLLLSGQFLGLPPGDRDPAIIQAAPATAYVYWEWSACGPGVEGAPGIEGLLADPEIKTLLAALEESLSRAIPPEAGPYDDGPSGEIEQTLRAELPKLLLLTAKHPGGVFIAGSDQPPSDTQRFPGEAAIIWNLGDDREAFLASLNRVLSLIPGYVPGTQPRTSVVSLPGITLTLHEDGARLILAVGTGTLERIQARWQQPAAELSGSPAFAKAWQAAEVQRVGSIVWVNLVSLRNDLQQKFGLPGTMIHGVAKSLGLSPVDSVMTLSGLDPQNFVSRTQITLTGKPEGLLTILSGRAVTAADLSHIPADADFVAAGSLDLRAVHRSLRDMVAQAAPDVLGAFDEFQTQLELELKLQLKDVFQGFGEIWTVYDAPSTGGVLLSGMIAAIPVEDADRAEAVFRRVMEMVRESLPPIADGEGTTLKETLFAGETIYYFNSTGYTIRYEGHPPISPAFCLTKRHVLMALHPQALKAHLRFLQSTEPRFSQLTEKIPVGPGDPLVVFYADTPRIGQTIAPLIPLLVKPTLAEWQAQGIPVDMATIPSVRAVLPYLRPATMTAVRTPDGLLIEQRNTLPIWLSLLVLPQLGITAGETFHEDGMLQLEGRQKATLGAPAVQLGAAEGVVPAKAEEPAKPAVAEPTALENAARRTLPFIIRELIPDQIEGFIPPQVFQQLAQPPDPEKAAQRAAERQRRKEERAARRAARLAK